MRIAIDARLNAYRQGGIPQYTRQLMTALAEIAREDQIVSLQHREHLRPLVVAPNVTRHSLYTPPHHRFEQWSLPLEALLARPDVLHCPDFIAPMRRPFPAVVTIHDLAFLHYPHILDDEARAYYGQVKASALRADAVIAVSEATRQDVAQLLDVPIGQVDVIHEAAAPLYGRIELRPGEVRVLDGTPVSADTFLLFVSTLEPRKNLPTLLKALRICLDRKPSAGYTLVVAGTRGWRNEEIFATVRELHLQDHVIFAPRVGQYDLRWLYNACRIYINPSLYEGFGLPLLEAMACGAPCLAAATSSLPEIGGEAAIYIPPLDAGLWADAITELWEDEEHRADLSRRGRVQSQHFSWTRAARETLAVYQRVIERRPRIAEPERPAPVLPLVPEDTCSRCGAPLAKAYLASGASLNLDGLARASRTLSAEARVCLNCGRVHADSATVRITSAPELSTPQPAHIGEPDAAETNTIPVISAMPAAAEEPGAPEPLPAELPEALPTLVLPQPAALADEVERSDGTTTADAVAGAVATNNQHHSDDALASTTEVATAPAESPPAKPPSRQRRKQATPLAPAESPPAKPPSRQRRKQAAADGKPLEAEVSGTNDGNADNASQSAASQHRTPRRRRDRKS